MKESKAYNITFSHEDGEEDTIKMVALSEENATKFLKIFFPDSEIISIEESIVKIVLEDLQPN